MFGRPKENYVCISKRVLNMNFTYLEYRDVCLEANRDISCIISALFYIG